MPDHPTGQTMRFQVKLDGGADLGNWSKCDGLAIEYETVEYKEGGENGYVHRIPGRAKYQNIKLTRPLNQDTKKVTAWIASLRAAVQRQTAQISALDTEGKVIASWNLDGVYPVKWNGPSLDVGNNQVATESLELAHNGFLA
jgi:phage tail-like protein